MSHEIAHVAACHAARQNTRGQLMNFASIPLIFVGGGIGYAAQNIAGLALPLGFLKFARGFERDRKSTRLNSSHSQISYAVFCLKKKKKTTARHSSTSKSASCAGCWT